FEPFFAVFCQGTSGLFRVTSFQNCCLPQLIARAHIRVMAMGSALLFSVFFIHWTRARATLRGRIYQLFINASDLPHGCFTFIRVTFVERSEEHTSELQSRFDLVCRLLLE